MFNPHCWYTEGPKIVNKPLKSDTGIANIVIALVNNGAETIFLRIMMCKDIKAPQPIPLKGAKAINKPNGKLKLKRNNLSKMIAVAILRVMRKCCSLTNFMIKKEVITSRRISLANTKEYPEEDNPLSLNLANKKESPTLFMLIIKI